ncbi:hypothetical protein GCM10010156_30100 [Planobispora rosea]|uniref:Acetyltransferase n=1 Tax=Planobispora rosea TaxID=35762 RepID=A0A8J3RVF9_PLARO|nr:hypothetical protein [Planobispora rosea]GGS69125.1 hypothetical protein GCM10010156_30100 [Planobispora rosea]GIH82095.1 hypothetical protein Pro02_05030 [Planobispora rosea]
MTIELRAVAEDDLPFLNRLTNDPDGVGLHQWYGRHAPTGIAGARRRTGC